MNILLAEDDYMIADLIGQSLQAEGYKVVGHVPSLEEAKKWLANGENPRPDMCLLDIELHGNSGNTDGIELGRHITEQYQIQIIYLTGLVQDLVIQAAATNPLMYCVKSDYKTTLLNHLKLLAHRPHPAPPPEATKDLHTPPSITITRGRGNYVNMLLADIIFIESNIGTGDIYIHASNNRVYPVSSSITRFLQDINKVYLDNPLLRVHQSYVVNTKYINGYADNVLTLRNTEMRIAVSRNYRKIVRELLERTRI